MPNTTIHLREAALAGGLASPRFFNGRLLSGEALTELQSHERAQRQRLGRALGPGVVDGLWVRAAAAPSPALRVQAGEAINSDGEVLRLAQDVELTLAEAPDVGSVASDAAFQPRAVEWVGQPTPLVARTVAPPPDRCVAQRMFGLLSLHRAQCYWSGTAAAHVYEGPRLSVTARGVAVAGTF